MKLAEIAIPEMTMRVGSFEPLANYLPEYEKLLKDGKHIGDIEELKVFKRIRGENIDYAIFNEKDQIAGFFMLVDSTLEVAYIIPNYRGTNLLAKILFFLKRNEGISRITLSDRHSEATIAAVKKIYHRFDRVVWTKDGEQDELYDPATINKYYSITKPTGWVLVLENDYNFSSWPKFYDRQFPDTRTIYESLLNAK